MTECFYERYTTMTRSQCIGLIVLVTVVAANSQTVTAQVASKTPSLHYRPDEGSFADAIPFFWKGMYHVFYLRAGVAGGTPWEHISSTDLVHWREHPTALTLGSPDEPDGKSVFTGSITERDGVFHAWYTGWNPESDHRERIMHATSNDLITWTKHPEHTFHADGEVYLDDEGKDFRDPFIVWDDQTQEYWMLLYSRQASDGRGVLGRYASKDLVHWRPIQRLNCGAAGECPDLFREGDRWHLLQSRGGMWTASSDRLDGRYEPQGTPQLDTPMLYAVKRLYDGRRHIGFGFVRDLRERSDFAAPSWGGTMCLPRQIYADQSGKLRTQVPDEIVQACSETFWDLSNQPQLDVRAGEWTYEGATLKAKGDHVCGVFDVPADYMLLLETKPSPIGKMVIRFRDQGAHDVGYTLTVDMFHQTTELRGPLYTYERRTPIPNDKPVVVRAFLDSDILECFVNDAHSFTIRCYDFRDGDLMIQANDGGLTVQKLELRQLPH